MTYWIWHMKYDTYHQEDKDHTSWAVKGVNSGDVPQAWDGPVFPGLTYSTQRRWVRASHRALYRPTAWHSTASHIFTFYSQPSLSYGKEQAIRISWIWSGSGHNSTPLTLWGSSGAPCASRQGPSLRENPDFHMGRNRHTSCWRSRLGLFG